MDPVTINLDGLSEFAAQFGPFGYLIGHGLAAMFFGIVAWRNIGVAGTCHGLACIDRNNALSKEEKQQATQCDAYIARSVVSGVVGVVNFIVVIVVSANLFCVALDRSKTSSQIHRPDTTVTWSTIIHERPYVATTADGKQFSINTLRNLQTRAYQDLKILVAEASGMDSVPGLSLFLERCHRRKIPVTTIEGEDKTIIYDNPGCKPVEIDKVPFLALGFTRFHSWL